MVFGQLVLGRTLDSAFNNLDVLLWHSGALEDLLFGQIAHKLHVGDYTAEDDMVTIEPSGWNQGDEELGAIGVLAVVGHAHPSCRSVAEYEVLVDELVAIDASAAGTITVQEISGLNDEVSDDSVHWRVLVRKGRLERVN